jgi:hypothetical protein
MSILLILLVKPMHAFPASGSEKQAAVPPCPASATYSLPWLKTRSRGLSSPDTTVVTVARGAPAADAELTAPPRTPAATASAANLRVRMSNPPARI